jgi:hypothetical protein
MSSQAEKAEKDVKQVMKPQGKSKVPEIMQMFPARERKKP